MNDDYDKFIRPNLVFLTENIDPSDLTRHLADVLKRTDKEQIECDQDRKGNTKAAWTLLERLRHRENWFEEKIRCEIKADGPTAGADKLIERLGYRENGYQRLLLALWETGSKHIVQKIKPDYIPPPGLQASAPPAPAPQPTVAPSPQQTIFNNCTMSNVQVGDQSRMEVNHAPLQPPPQSGAYHQNDDYQSLPVSRGSDDSSVIIERRNNDTPSLSSLPIDSSLGFDHPQGAVGGRDERNIREHSSSRDDVMGTIERNAQHTGGAGRLIRNHSPPRDDTMGTMERHVQHTAPKSVSRYSFGDPPPPYTVRARPGESRIEAGARQPYPEVSQETDSAVRPPTDIIPKTQANALNQAPVRTPGYRESFIDERSRSMNPSRLESTGNGNDPECMSMESELSSSGDGVTRLKRFQTQQQSEQQPVESHRSAEEPMRYESDYESFHRYPLRDTQEPEKRHPDQYLLFEAAAQWRRDPEYGTARPDPEPNNLNATTIAEDTRIARLEPASELNNLQNIQVALASPNYVGDTTRDAPKIARPDPVMTNQNPITTTAQPPSDDVTTPFGQRPPFPSNPRVPFEMPHVDPLMTNFDLTMDSNITAAQRAAREAEREAERQAAEEERRSCTGSCESSTMGEEEAGSNPGGNAQAQGAHGGDSGVSSRRSSGAKRQSHGSPGVLARSDLRTPAGSQSVSPQTTNQKGAFSERSGTSAITGRSKNPVSSVEQRNEVMDSGSVELATSLYDIPTNDAAAVLNASGSTIQSQFITSVPNTPGTDQQSEFTNSLPHNSVVPSPIQPAQNPTTEVPDFGQLGSFSLSVHGSANEPSLQGVPMSPKGDGNISRAVIGPNHQNGGDDGASHVTEFRVVNDANQQTENIEHVSNASQVDNQTIPSSSSEVILTQRVNENEDHNNGVNETRVNNEQVEERSTLSNRLLIISTFVVFGALAVGMVYRYSRHF